MIEITANGTKYSIETGLSLPDFLAQQGLAPERVVVEKNGMALTPSETKETILEAADQLEIVRIVAGG